MAGLAVLLPVDANDAAVASILPLYILVRNLGMLDNITMLAIIYTG